MVGGGEGRVHACMRERYTGEWEIGSVWGRLGVVKGVERSDYVCVSDRERVKLSG